MEPFECYGWMYWEMNWVKQIVDEVQIVWNGVQDKDEGNVLLTVAFYPDFILPNDGIPGCIVTHGETRWYQTSMFTYNHNHEPLLVPSLSLEHVLISVK